MFDVFIPTKNSAKTLNVCLESVKSEIPYNRIIAVDGHSVDDTRNILTRHGVIVYEQLGDGVGDARAQGLRYMKTPVFFTIDSDAILPQGYFKAIYPSLADSKIAWACAPVIFGSGSIATYYRERAKRKAHHYSLANAFLRLSAVLEVGGFNPSLPVGEDIDLRNRLLKAGYKQFISDKVEITHPRTFREELKAVKWWGATTNYLGSNIYYQALRCIGSGFKWAILLLPVDPRLLILLPIRGAYHAYGVLSPIRHRIVT